MRACCHRRYRQAVLRCIRPYTVMSRPVCRGRKTQWVPARPYGAGNRGCSSVPRRGDGIR